jgi:hypothetical protein
MLRDAFPIREALLDSTRFPRLPLRSSAVDRAEALEIGWLVAMGVAAAAVTSALDFGLRLPGHAILRSVPLMAIGLATVPRRNGGWLLGLGALLGLAGLWTAGRTMPGLGSGTSLVLIGPMLEWALRGASDGWRVYLSFAMAGLGSNWAALLVRATPKVLGLEGGRGQSLGRWLPWAVLTYTACGLLAGLLSAWIGFRARTRADSPHRPQGTS